MAPGDDLAELLPYVLPSFFHGKALEESLVVVEPARYSRNPVKPAACSRCVAQADFCSGKGSFQPCLGGKQAS